MTDQDKTVETLISEQAVNSFGAAPDARYKQIMQSLVRHLHAFVSDVELTEQEWFEGIRFLTETGHKCDGLVRQEFILLSDTLGVSMLVDAINHRHSANASETTVFGPFFIEGMPEREFGENMAFTPGETGAGARSRSRYPGQSLGRCRAGRLANCRQRHVFRSGHRTALR